MLTYLYYRTVFTIWKACWSLAVTLAPTSLVQTIVTKKLESFGIKVTVMVDGEKEKGQEEEVTTTTTTTDDDGKKKNFKCEMTVRDRRFFKRFASDPDLAHGESYMDGWIDSSDLAMQNQCFLGGGLRDIKANWLFRARWMLQDKVVTSWNQQSQGTKSMEVIDLHYNLGNDLFEAMLDKTMNYTCAYFNNNNVKDDDDLYQAQIEKMDLIGRKLKLKPGMKVLDIGCGFGATAKYLAEKFKVKVVGVNISKEQLAFARQNCEGLPVEFIVDDYRNLSGKEYDRVYSIGFFEAVGINNFREYFEVVDRVLKDDGLTLLHSITLMDSTLPRTGAWINKYIFPGGELPYPQHFIDYAQGLFLVEDLHNFGPSYAKTLRCWKKRFVASWPKLEAKYGPMFDGKFYRMWMNYLEGCIGTFEIRGLNLYQVVYTKQGYKEGVPTPGYVSER